MKLTVTAKTTFDFKKLSKHLKESTKKLANDLAEKEAIATKDRLSKGKTITGSMEKLSDVGKLTRQLRGQNPSSPPLNATGALKNSIKAKNGAIRGKKYGIYHNEGFKTKNRPIIPKRGKNRQLFNFAGRDGQGTDIPKRQFLQNDKSYKYDKKMVDKFMSDIAKNLKK